MATLFTSEGIPAPRKAKTKPQRIVRGRRLKTLVGAIQHLQTLANQDHAESVRAFTRGYTPFLILGTTNSNTMRQFNALLATLQAAKARKV